LGISEEHDVASDSGFVIRGSEALNAYVSELLRQPFCGPYRWR
jgi:hypothetical protein